MPDQKISELAAITTIDNAADVLPIVDTSATTTKKVTPTQLKTSLALNNVDNTSDANKPVSSAQQTALDAKQATLVSGTNIKTVNNTSLLGSGNISISSAVAWGGVTGTLSNQTDLQSALDAKTTANTAITGATKTKVTYDAKGLVTAGADATTADIADSTNKRYVTDANLTVIQNTSGTNTGDNAVNSLYSGLATSKQDTLVSGTNIKTVNSTSLLGSGDITISANPSGVAGAIQFSDGSAFASDATNLFWDDTNNRLGVGTNAPVTNFEVYSGIGGYISHNASSGYNGFSGFRCNVAGGTRGYMELNPSTGEFKVGADGSGYFLTLGAAGVERMRVTSTGTIVKGSGSTSATTSLLVQNSAGTAALTVKDDLSATFGGSISNNGSATFGILFTNQACIGVINSSGNAFNVMRTNNSTGNATFDQSVAIGTTSAPVASAGLEVVSTTKGFLPPRMTTTQKNAISSPAAGLVVYDSTTNKLCCYNGSTWNDLF